MKYISLVTTIERLLQSENLMKEVYYLAYPYSCVVKGVCICYTPRAKATKPDVCNIPRP